MSGDIATLGLAIDSRQLTAANAALEQLAAKGNAAAVSADKLASSGVKSETVMRAIESAAKRNNISVAEMTARVDANSASHVKMATAHGTAVKAMTSLASSAKQAGNDVAESGKQTQSATGLFGGLMKGVDGLKGQMVALSAGAGPVGTLLAGFGPIGFAAAAGLGAVSVVFSELSTRANALGDKANKVRDFADAVNLTATEFGALQIAGNASGLSTEKVAVGIERLVGSMADLRNGTGTMLAAIRRIDPDLADQLAKVDDTTKALDLLSAAYAKAGQFQQAQLAKAAFGPGGVRSGGLLGTIADAGGLQNYIALQQKNIVLTNAQTNALSDLKRESDESGARVRDTIASWFSEVVLTHQRDSRVEMERLLKSVKEFSNSTAPSWWAGFKEWAATGNRALIGSNTPYSPGVGRGSRSGREGDLDSVLTPSAPVPETAASVNARTQAQMIALGSAATASDKYQAAVAKLNADIEANTHLEGIRGRAMAALGLDRIAAQQTLYTTALGTFATTQDKVTAASVNFQKAQAQDPRLTNSMRDKIKNETAAIDEWTTVNKKAQIGVFDLGYATKAAGDQLRDWINHDLLDPNNPTQYAAALTVLNKQLRDTSDAAKVAGSAFPQLQSALNDAGNINKQMDTVGTSSLTNLNSSLLDYQTGAKGAAEATKDFEKQFVRSILSMLNQMIIIQPIAMGLKSLLGSISGIGGFGSLLGLGGGADPGSSTRPLAGLTAADYGPGFASGGYTGSGGKNEPAGIVHRGEYVMDAATTSRIGVGNLNKLRGYAGGGYVTPAQSGGDSGIRLVVNNNGAPIQVTDVQQTVDGHGQPQVSITIDQAVGAALSRPGSASRGAMRNNFGARPVGVKR